ncbi:MAG: hypothetical protein QOD41_3650 [Cryptosporangiaceae bacterium]|jgi:hypothetical protein|nr:hypothetical protein [Cryptosporangiaceae bacterium]
MNRSSQASAQSATAALRGASWGFAALPGGGASWGFTAAGRGASWG